MRDCLRNPRVGKGDCSGDCQRRHEEPTRAMADLLGDVTVYVFGNKGEIIEAAIPMGSNVLGWKRDDCPPDGCPGAGGSETGEF